MIPPPGGGRAKLARLYRRADPDEAHKNRGQKRYCRSGGGVVELFDDSGAQMGIYSRDHDGNDSHWHRPSPLDRPFSDLPPLLLEQ